MNFRIIDLRMMILAAAVAVALLGALLFAGLGAAQAGAQGITIIYCADQDPETPRCDGTGQTESLVGMDTRDVIRAFAGDDIINAERGADEAFGGPGVDNVNGGRGDDELSGGRGLSIALKPSCRLPHLFLAPPFYTPYNTRKEVYKVRTNIVLDDELVEEAFRYAGVSTKRELVELALREFVENHRRHDVRELRGKVRLRAGYDHKAMRERQEVLPEEGSPTGLASEDTG